ncbi:MAG: 4-hydroxy-3-methylbut-2-enyl diphosphate reductase [Elusimicrobiota bacterium]
MHKAKGKYSSKVIIAQNAGFCYGVKRAIEQVEAELGKENKKIVSIGSLIHNPQMVEMLKNKGLKKIESYSGSTPEDTIVIPAHGVIKKEHDSLRLRKGGIIDATCVFVKRAQRLAEKLNHAKCDVILILGDSEHPEVRSLLSYAGKKAVVIDSIDKLKKLNLNKSMKVGLISQTTQTSARFNQFKKYLKTQGIVFDYYNTICRATVQRQKSSEELAKKADLMIVIGGKNSANTRRLAETCMKYQKRTYHIENENELRKVWFNHKSVVGITAGASTPEFLIKKIFNQIYKMVKQGGCK